MSVSRQSKNFWTGALMASLAFIGSVSVHADTSRYSSEDFEGGIPNYTLAGTGPYTLTQLLDDSGTNITSSAALAGTDYTAGSPSRSGIWTNSSLPGTIVNEPEGKHGFVCNSQNRTLVLTNPMTLDSDGVTSLEISFDTMLYAFSDARWPYDNFIHTAKVYYSALGDFTDAVLIKTYATADREKPTSLPDSTLGHTVLKEDEWSKLTLTLSSTDVSFTDTAKIRFNKDAPNSENQMVFYDNISVTGVILPRPTVISVH